MADDPKAPPADAAQQQAVQIPVDSEHMMASYANFFRVTGTPEELVLDFGLNTQQVTPSGQPEAVKLTQRLTMSFYTAKRLLNALQWAVSRYETNFGVLETDFQKRMRTPGGLRPPGS
ncbi:MAG: DUF3467 domain-containing protein [Gemmataceae bacterium]